MARLTTKRRVLAKEFKACPIMIERNLIPGPGGVTR